MAVRAAASESSGPARPLACLINVHTHGGSTGAALTGSPLPCAWHLALLLLLSLSLPPVFAKSALAEGIELYQQKNYRAALQALSRALSDGSNPTVLYYAALCYQQLGDTTHATEYYKLVHDRFPKSQESELAGRGLALLMAGPGPAVGLPPGKPAPGAASPPRGGRMFDSQLSEDEWQKLPEETRVPFFRGASTHLFVDGAVNGRSIRMMFDTGAEPCVFSRKALETAGVDIHTRGTPITLGGVGGTMTAQMMDAQITIGDITRTIPILVSDRDVGFPIVGESFFREFDYSIDNSTGFIDFKKKARPGTSTSDYETDVIKIPYKDAGNNMMVVAKVNGKPFPMFFDTGAFGICFSSLHAAALGLAIPPDAQRVATSGAGGTVMGYKFYLDRLELGPIIKTHIPIVVNRGATPSVPLLGQTFFGDRKFTVDNDDHVIKFVH